MKAFRLALLALCVTAGTGGLQAQILGGGARAGDGGIAIDGTVDGDVVVGNVVNCAPDLSNTSFDNSDVSIHVAKCEGPERLNVQYLWLDLNAAAIVMSSTIPAELSGLFGSRPFVRSTEVWEDVAGLLKDHGTLWQQAYDFEAPEETRPIPSVPSALSLTLYARSEQRRLNFGNLVQSLIDAGERNPFVRYLPTEPFPWPDLEQAAPFTSGTTWPEADYTYVWEDGIGALRQQLVDDLGFFPSADTALACVVPYRFLSRNEYDRYWDILRYASDAVEAGEISGFRFLPGPPFSGPSPYWEFSGTSDEVVVRPIRAGHSSYDVIAYFGRHNWPADYVVTAGSHYGPNTCWGTPGGFTVSVLPRQPFVLFAVISPQGQGEEVTITGLNLRRDPGPELRTEVDYADALTVSLASEFRLTRDRPLLVPLRLDLRYDLGAEPLAAITGTRDSANRIRETLQRFAPDPVEIENSPDWRAARPLSELPEPSTAPITRRYIYGASFAIASVETVTTTFAVAEPPAAALISGRWTQGGSCPYVSFFDENGVRLDRHRVLVGASAPDLAMREEVRVPEGTHTIRIEEIEPEISYLSSIALHGPNGEQMIIADQALRPGEGLEITIPEGIRTLSVEGFYELL